MFYILRINDICFQQNAVSFLYICFVFELDIIEYIGIRLNNELLLPLIIYILYIIKIGIMDISYLDVLMLVSFSSHNNVIDNIVFFFSL